MVGDRFGLCVQAGDGPSVGNNTNSGTASLTLVPFISSCRILQQNKSYTFRRSSCLKHYIPLFKFHVLCFQ